MKTLKRIGLMITVATLFGCTTTSLRLYTLGQINTIEEYRKNAALECLATVAASPDTLPSFALLANGATHLQDTGTVTSNTVWTRALEGFATESLSLTASRTPLGQWTVDPVASYVQIEALRAACRWAVFGPEAAWNESPGLLLDPATDYAPLEPHFGVANRLAQLPPNWVHVGHRGDVPKNVVCKAHRSDTWVWVLPTDELFLSEFILILHDIATLNPDAAGYSAPLLVTITRQYPTNLSAADASKSSGGADKTATSNGEKENGGASNGTVRSGSDSNKQSLTFVEYRVVKPEYRRFIESQLAEARSAGGDVNMTEGQWIEATYAYNGNRTAAKAAATGSPATQEASARDFIPRTRDFPVNLPSVTPNPRSQRVKDMQPPPLPPATPQ
jgi:hypothetical protein